MAKIVYPLERVLDIKKKRVTEAEKLVADKKRDLEKEEEKLKQREAERDKVLNHRKDKLNQLRDELDGGTTSTRILQMKAYLKVVEERLKVEEKKVADQKELVKIAEKNLEAAKEQLRLRRQEVDKLGTHRTDWMKEAKKEEQIAEEKEMDEIGQVLYTIRQRKKY